MMELTPVKNTFNQSLIVSEIYLDLVLAFKSEHQELIDAAFQFSKSVVKNLFFIALVTIITTIQLVSLVVSFIKSFDKEEVQSVLKVYYSEAKEASALYYKQAVKQLSAVKNAVMAYGGEDNGGH